LATGLSSFTLEDLSQDTNCIALAFTPPHGTALRKLSFHASLMTMPFYLIFADIPPTPPGIVVDVELKFYPENEGPNTSMIINQKGLYLVLKMQANVPDFSLVSDPDGSTGNIMTPLLSVIKISDDFNFLQFS